MAVVPFGPWRSAGDPGDGVDDPDAPTIVEPTFTLGWISAFYGLFRELTKVGCPPPVARKMQVWEAAAALGVGTKVIPKVDPNAEAPGMSGVSNAELQLIKDRLAYEAGLGPKPEPRPPSELEIAEMMRIMEMQ